MTNARPCTRFGWIALRAGLVACAVACGKSEPQAPAAPAAKPEALEAPKPAAEAPAAQAPAAQPAPAAPAQPAYMTAPTFDAAHPWLGPGWSKLSMKDETKFCVFANKMERETSMLIDKVKKQTLQADMPVTFGVFGPWCLNKECDALPNLQCWVDVEADNTLVLSTRFSSFHKDGSTCTKDCMPLDPSCDTPALAKGTYTIKHGDKTYKLQIPSTVKQPCLNLK